MALIGMLELPQWLQQDGAKLFFFASVMVAIYTLTRWVSRKSESSYEPHAPTQADMPEADEAPDANTAFGETEEEDSDWLPSMRDVNFTLRWMRFKSFELSDGPPDPECFCDELEIELNYRNGTMPWTETWVATPKGLEAKLGNGKWKSFYARQILIVKYYDPVEIQTTVLNHIRQELESVPDEAAEDEMKSAQGAS